MKTLAGVTLSLVLAAAAWSEDSLADAARRERERRRAAAAKARGYTDADLASGRAPSEARPSPSPSISPTPGADTSSDEAAQRAALEKLWRGRFSEARQRLREADARAYETVVEPVFVGDGTRGVWVPMQVRRKIETEELRQARRALSDLEEELRVAGLPPGWGRE